MGDQPTRGTPAIAVVGRSQAYLLLAGVVVGLLAAGLAVPLVFGESVVAGAGEGASDFTLPGSDAIDPTTGAPVTTVAAGQVPGAYAVGQPGGPAAPGGVGAPGSPGSPGGDVGPGGPTPGQPLTATDRGVTAETIRVGFLVLDVATVGRLGVAVAIDPEQQMAAFQAYVDEVNARGGIHGRMIEPYFRAFDVTDRNDQVSACRELTQDHEVFAVLGGFNTVDPNLCIVEENQTPLISNQANNPDWVFARADGRLFTMYPRSGRMMAALVAEMERVDLAGRRLGIMTDGLNDPGGQVAAQLEDLLSQAGHEVVYTGQLSDDISTAASQVPIEVNRMQTAGGTGAEVVIFLSGNSVYGTQFVNQASNQGYHPIYVTSDWASGAGDTSNNNMPEDYDGAISFTSGRGLPNKEPPVPTPAAERCREIYNQYSGRTLEEPGPGDFSLTIGFCDDMRIFEALAVAAGPELTRSRLSEARSTLGAFDSAAYSPGTFGADKFDSADLIRTQQWGFDCKCWHSIDQFHEPGG